MRGNPRGAPGRRPPSSGTSARSVATEVLLDTNVFLRHLLQDHPEQSPASTALLERIESGVLAGWVTPMAVAEMVWVLSGSTYGLTRDDIRDGLSALLELPGLRVVDNRALRRALELYASLSIDFIDAYHGALAEAAGGVVYSFDRDFDRIPGVTRLTPEAGAG
ncbi:MAG: type II toxin-antitoxin system VapC family toxin [Chloroflexi bacterium]|nr:type II toxin-antitoxin system VapC family toxin [Chloroflexota bacterium]PWB48148.1 MAG: VapC toxin family PIN domain ribonuclease [Dehalococcoidia bacterium]